MTDSTVRILEAGDETALETFLRPRIESSMFLLSNLRAAGFVDNSHRNEGTYAAVFADDKITGVAAHFWNGNIILQNPDMNHDVWRMPVRASGRGINGLLGPGDQVHAVQTVLDVEPGRVQLADREFLFKVDLAELAIPSPLADGQVRGRRAQPADLDILTGWNVAYNIEMLGEVDRPELWRHSHTTVARRMAENVLWVVEAEGQLVAMTSFNATLREAVQVGGVYTPPDRRRRGYARAAVARSLLDARAEGVETGILFTDEENIAAQKAYQAIGFQIIDEYGLVLYREPIKETL